MLADQLDYVVGVDTHRDRHALAVVAAATGALVLEAEVDADRRGYERALMLAAGRAPGARRWAIEGSGSYGAGLARFLAARGEQVVEVERPQRHERRKGKSDRIDALRAARAALGATKLALPRAGGAREALRALLTTREGAVATRRAALNQLRR
jgi:transposase